MMTFSKFKESTITAFKRVLKVDQFGTKTALESSPFGIDSSPIKDMIAVYSNTSNDSESVVVGYINKNQIAESGETRLFSLNDSGILKAYLHLKKDGIIEINGNDDFAVKFNSLYSKLIEAQTAINLELTKLNTAVNTSIVASTVMQASSVSETTSINVELGKIAVAINAIAPGSYTPTPIVNVPPIPPTPSVQSPISLDISSSKNTQIKTN